MFHIDYVAGSSLYGKNLFPQRSRPLDVNKPVHFTI